MADNNNKWGVIFCPRSGALRPHAKWEKVEKCLKEKGIDYVLTRYMGLEEDEPLYAMIREAL